jgi:Domain of Unknown Function (DUF1080)
VVLTPEKPRKGGNAKDTGAREKPRPTTPSEPQTSSATKSLPSPAQNPTPETSQTPELDREAKLATLTPDPSPPQPELDAPIEPMPTPVPDFAARANWVGLMKFWTIDKGVIAGSTHPSGLPNLGTYLCSKHKYRDFELRFQVKLTGQSPNSGLFIRSTIKDNTTFRAIEGPEIDIVKGGWGSVVYQGQTIIRGGRLTIEEIKKTWREDDFNAYTIRCVGKHLTITVNNVITWDKDNPSIPDEGIIAWQMYNGRPMTVTFRDIEFYDLSKTPEVAEAGKGRPAQTDFDPPLGPLERKAVTIRYRYDIEPTRMVKVRTLLKARGPGQGQTVSPAPCLEGLGLETTSQRPEGGAARLYLVSTKLWSEKGGQTTALHLTAETLIPGQCFGFIYAGNGAIRERGTPDLNGTSNPMPVRQDFDYLINRFCSVPEMTCVSVPAEEIQPGTSWGARLASRQGEIGNLRLLEVPMTCTFEGVRRSNGGQLAQIAIKGKLHERGDSNRLVGTFTGKVFFAIDRGYVALAHLKVEETAQTVEMDLSRAGAGNLKQPVEPEPMTAPLVGKEVLLKYKLAPSPRTIRLSVAFKTMTLDSALQLSREECTKVEMVESLSRDAGGALDRLRVGSVKNFVQFAGQSTPLPLELEKRIPGRANPVIPYVAAIPEGKLMQIMPVTAENFQGKVRNQFQNTLRAITRGYELTCVPVPAGVIRPGASWQSTMMVNHQEQGAEVRCTYKGCRLHDGHPLAQVEVRGTIGEALGRASNTPFTGTVHFDIAGGYIARADMQVEGYLDVHLTRTPGNLLGIEP